MPNDPKNEQNTASKLAVYFEKFKVYREKVLVLGNDSLEKTIAVALAVCFVCAILVSFSAVALRPLQQYNKDLDMKKNILDVAGLMNEDTDIDDAFKQLVEPRLVDLATGEYVTDVDVASYDQRKATKDPATSIDIPSDKDIASIRRKAKLAKIYIVKNKEKIQSIILPVNGYGLWSTLYGFLAVEPDGQTVQSINFYDQAETPGLGGEVVNPKWRKLWKGKKIYSQEGIPILGLVKGNVDTSKPDAVYKVDGLAGATLTSVGVTNLIKYWMGNDGFAKYLDKVKSEG